MNESMKWTIRSIQKIGRFMDGQYCVYCVSH